MTALVTASETETATAPMSAMPTRRAYSLTAWRTDETFSGSASSSRRKGGHTHTVFPLLGAGTRPGAQALARARRYGPRRGTERASVSWSSRRHAGLRHDRGRLRVRDRRRRVWQRPHALA